MNIVKRTFIFFIFLILVAGCSDKKAPSDRIVLAIESSPNTFDPRLAVSAYSMHINKLIYNGLMKFDRHFNIVPDLAERFDQIDDTTYKFKLRKGIVFHSGHELSLDDVIYTFNSMIDGTIPSPFRASFNIIDKIEKISDDAFIIRLKEPNAPFLTALTKGIIPKEEAERLGEDFGHKPSGTGPYQLVEFKEDSHVILKKNPHYFGKKGEMPFLEFRVLRDDNVRVLQLIKGNIDLIQNAVPPVLLDMLKKRGLDVVSSPSIVFDYMGLNLKDAILSKPIVRRAIAYGINRDAIIKYKWEGYAEEADTLLSPGHWARNEDVKKYEYNPEKAKKLLDEAGYPDPNGNGERFHLSYKTSTQKRRVDIANLIAKQLGEIGIGVTVTPYEWGTFFRDIKTANFQLYSLAWVGVTEPDIYFNVYHSSQFPPHGANRNRYVNKKIDRLTKLGRSTTEREKRRKIYYKVQEIVARELPYIPLWYEDNVVVKSSHVINYRAWPNGGFLGLLDAKKVSMRKKEGIE